MLLKTMISSWRKAFRNPEMPFVMIQLPRINDPSKIRAGWPEFREMQDAVAKTVPKVYSVNTIDPWLHQFRRSSSIQAPCGGTCRKYCPEQGLR